MLDRSNSIAFWRGAIALFVLASSVLATASLSNPSFETPALGAGSYTSSGIPGWDGGDGVWHIPTNPYFLTNAPDGLQIGYTNRPQMAQQSTNVVGIGTNTFSVQAGRRHDQFSGSFTMKIWAGGAENGGNVTGGTLLAQVPYDYTQAAPDTFTLLTATYVALPGDPVIGQLITVQFVRTAGSQIDIDDVRINSPAAEIVAPVSMTIQLGKATAGDIVSLANSDGNALTLCKFFVPNQNSPFVQFVVTGVTATSAPTSLAFQTRTAMVTSGSFQQTLKMLNEVTGLYEQSRTDSINTTYTNIQLYATGDPTRYIGSGGVMQGQVQVKQVGPSTSAFPCVNYDVVGWILTS